MCSKMGSIPIFVLVPFSLILFFFSESSAQEAVVKYNVREEQDALTFVGNVARDSLLYGNVTMDEFQRMKFQILVQGNQYASLFTIDESASTLRTKDVLDREIICTDDVACLLTFNVAVYIKDKDTDVLDLFKIIEIVINLEDINDNSPKFPHDEVTIPISENSPVDAEYFTNGAFDEDTGANNSVQSYVMEPPNEMFGLKVLQNPDGTSDLNIVVKYPLDRESRSFYQLVVYAVDGGFPVRTGTVKINITITDQNDNAPVFSETEYNVTVEENSAKFSTILLVTATDADFDENGKVRYQFNTRTSSKITDIFAINSTTGEITSKSVLDYEDFTNKWTFKIEAYDNGNPPRTTSVGVTINIADINDNYPQININLPPGGTKISEAADTGSFVAHVAVFDLDAGVNGEVKCKVLGEDFIMEDFKIKDNYKVVLNKPLDYEKTDKYEVSIQCEDGGNPPKTNATSFNVIVEDINDNYPEFNPVLYEVTVQEEVLQRTYIQVSAQDLDSGSLGDVTFGLHKDAPSGFYINSNSGLITVNKKFDREVDPVIRFFVLAWDGGEPSLTATATVVVNITDINDNPPLFPSNPVELHINESEHTQSVNLGVLDPDFGPNGQFMLTFPQNDYLKEYFSFNPTTGEIITVKSIDREEIPYFKFWVTAVDRGIPQKSSSAEVIILVDDINDNIPAITYPSNANKTKHVLMTVPVGFVVATVQASDKDDGLNSQLLYFIDSGDNRDIFKMDVNTGQITTGREMTEQDVDKYDLQIAVRDNGKIQRTSYAELRVFVEPTNDTSTFIQEEEQKQNLTIVAIFVGITVVLSVAIIVTIFIIRHIDRRNRREPAPKVTDSKYYETARPDESMSASSNMSRDSDADLLKKRSKKEVSFSIDGDSDCGNNSTFTNVTSFTTTKTLPSYLSMEYKPNESQSTSWLDNNTMTTSPDISKSDLYEKELPSLTTSQLQLALQQMEHHRSDRLWLQPVQEEQNKKGMIAVYKKADDNHSETSHETASDSGRGGSEEDIHSHRSHPLTDNEDRKPYYPHPHHRVQGHIPPPRLFPRRPPPPIPTDSYPRNISFSDDSVTANTTVASDKVPPLGSLSMSSIYKTPSRHHELYTISGNNSRSMYLDSQMTTPGLPYSMADIEDISEMATVCRDDASTTTSGSYTINPDDLCNEIDDLFFRDVIV